jgi:transposase
MPNFKDYKQGQQPGLFPLDISTLIPKTHLVRRVDAVIERVEMDKLQAVFSEMGASSYHPKMMLKVIIYSYSTGNLSSRKIAAMLRQDITYMWISGMQLPDFNTVNRFRSIYLKDVIEDVFVEVLMFLHEHGFIKFEDYYVDGTKMEADARKYSQVWGKNTKRYKKAVQEKVKAIMEEVEELNQQEDKLYGKGDLPEMGEASQISSEEVGEVAHTINQKLQEKKGTLSKKQQRTIKSKVNKLNKEKEKLEKYENQEAILGERNSYSKTDTDASMMRMKGTDELRPGYNIQVSSENQFATNYSLSQNASDSVAFPEHLEKIVERGEMFKPDNYVGDAAYGSEENYEKLQGKGIGNYLKHQDFHRKESKKFKENIFHKDNLEYDENQDFFICPNNKKLVYKETIEKKTINGYVQTKRVYECENCQGCPLKEKCTKAKGNRTIHLNRNLEKHKKIAEENLKSEKGLEFRKRRGPEIETFFGDLKHNQKYKRIRLRGLEKANLEIGYLCISYNLRKANGLLNEMVA